MVQAIVEPAHIKEEEEERTLSLVHVKLEPPQINEEQLERTISLVQVKVVPPQIKEEQEEMFLNQLEAVGSVLTFTVKSEDGDTNRETAPLASTLAEHTKIVIQADEEDGGAAQPACDVRLFSSCCFESDTDDRHHYPIDWEILKLL